MIPAIYNIATDCVDANADSVMRKDNTALISISCDKDGHPTEALRMSYLDLKSQTNQFANLIKKLGVAPGTRVLIRSHNIILFPLAFIGTIKAGCIPIPTSMLLSEKELAVIAEDSGAEILVTCQSLMPHQLLQENNQIKHLLVWPDMGGDWEMSEKAVNLLSALASMSVFFSVPDTVSSDQAYWLYTSGTSGRPKGVIHAHRSIPAHDERVRLWADMKETDVVFNTSNLNWSYALTAGLLDVWRHGATAVIFKGMQSPENIIKIIKNYGVTIFMSVPGIYRKIASYILESESVEAIRLSESDEPLAPVKSCLSAGEKLSDSVRFRFKEATDLKIREGLGMTEHSVYLFQRKIDPIVAGSCGKPAQDEQVTLLNNDLTPVKQGEMGILCSHRTCPGLMIGYYGDPEASSFNLNFHGEWYVSGDWAYKDVDGNYHYVGRGDDLITAGGYRISPIEVETMINHVNGVVESAVVGKELQPGKTIVVAFVVKEAGASEDSLKDRILDVVRKNMAIYKVPREIRFIDEMPKTKNGKLKRKELWSLM